MHQKKPDTKRCRAHKSVGTDFRYAVEFSKIKRAPAKASQPSWGQPDQRYPVRFAVSNRSSRPTRTRLVGGIHRLRCRRRPSLIVAAGLRPGSTGFPAHCPDLRRQQRESYRQVSGKSNLQVSRTHARIDAGESPDAVARPWYRSPWCTVTRRTSLPGRPGRTRSNNVDTGNGPLAPADDQILAMQQVIGSGYVVRVVDALVIDVGTAFRDGSAGFRGRRSQAGIAQ